MKEERKEYEEMVLKVTEAIGKALLENYTSERINKSIDTEGFFKPLDPDPPPLMFVTKEEVAEGLKDGLYKWSDAMANGVFRDKSRRWFDKEDLLERYILRVRFRFTPHFYNRE